MTDRLSQIATVARVTFLEARRNRITLAVLVFALVIVVASVLFQEVTTTALDRIVRDAGLAMIQGFGLVLAVLLGVSVVSREIDRKTVYMLVSKPLRRSDYIVGKLLGVALSIFATAGAMAVAFLVQQLLYGAPIRPVLFAACWLMLMELLVVASFSLFGSTFVSPIMSGFMSVGLFLIGELSSDLYAIALRSKAQPLRGLFKALFYVLPNFDRLNLKNEASILADVSIARVASGTAYAMVFVACFTLAAIAVFRGRDLK